MRRWNLKIAAADILLILVILLPRRVTTAAAQSGGPYDLTWSTVDGGGEMYSAGGAYTLAGGFWGGASAVHGLHLPLLLRDA